MLKQSTIQEIFLNNIQSEKQTGITFIEGENKTEYISYKKLYMEARCMLHVLQEKGIKPGDELVFQFLSNKNFLVTFWACVFGKIIPIPIVFGVNIDIIKKIKKVWERLDNPYLITDLPTLKDSWKEYLHNNSEVFVDIEKRFISLDEITYSKLAKVFPGEASDTVFVQFSSGSTGHPKGIVNKQEGIIYNINTMSNLIEIEEKDSFLGWMPLTHDLGLVFFHIFPLLKNVPQFLMPPMEFFAYPEIWIKSLAKNSITISGSPNFGFKHAIDNIEEKNLEGLSFEKLRLLINGAEPVSIEMCDDFEHKLAPYGLSKGVVGPAYGLAESVLGVSFTLKNQELTREYNLNRHNLKVGKEIEFVTKNSPEAISFANLGPYTGTEIKITDRDMNVLPERTLGIVHLRSVAVTEEFYNDSLTTAETISEEGWLNTGDLGFIDNEHLILTGREKEMILINGQNYFPNDLEELITELPEITFQQAIICSLFNKEKFHDDIYVFIVHNGSILEFINLEKEIKDYIAQRTGLEIEKVIAVDKIPKTTSGKIQRFVLLKNYKEGNYNNFLKELNSEKEKLVVQIKEEPENLNTDEVFVKNELTTIWKQLLGVNLINEEDDFFHLGGNSLTLNRLISRVHKSFGIDISIRDAFKNRTIKAQLELISTRPKINFDHIPLVKNQKFYPQSDTQKRMFILNQMNPEMTAYNVPIAFKLSGDIDIERFENAFQKIINRHEVLRTSFHLIEGEPIQRIHETVDFAIEVFSNSKESLEQSMKNFIRSFDLSTPSLIRVGLKVIQADEAYLLIDMHHIITDGVSYVNMMQDFVSFIDNENIEALGIQYKDYAVWQQKEETENILAEQKKFWLHQFSNVPGVLNLPTDFTRPRINSFQGATESFELSKQELIALNKICDKQHVSMYNVMLASFVVLLSKLSGQEDIVIGTSTAGRQHLDLEKLVGVFINTVAIRNYPKGNENFSNFLNTVQNTALQSFTNQEYSYEKLVEDLGLKLDLSHNPLFDIMFEYYNFSVSEFKSKKTHLNHIEYVNTSSKLDISFRVFEKENNYVFYLDYRTDLFKQGTIKRFISYYKNILKVVMENIDIKLSDINILPEEEYKLLVEDYNATSLDYAKETNLVSVFEAQAQKYPERVAVFYGKEKLTYEELNKRSNQVANYLISEGIVPGNMVGLMFERSVSMIVGMLGVLKTGAAYLPIDPSLPEQRISYMLNQSRASFLLTQNKFVERFTAYLPVKSFDSAKISSKSVNDVMVEIYPTDMAYCIFTSGSSGKPKGVMVNHRSVINLVKGLEQRVYNSYKEERLNVALLASFSFDASVQQIYGCLLQGHSLYVVDEDSRGDGMKLKSFYQRNEIDVSDGTPTHLRLVMDALGEDTSLGNLSSWILAGEALPKELVKNFYAIIKDGIQLYNFYGPTETCVDSTSYRIDRDSLDDYTFIPIGKPLPNERIYLVDTYGKLVPVGVPGELCIAGDGLAQYYVGDQNTSAEKFRSNWIIGEDRVYLTGDIARWLPDGNLEYCGRIDDQVKLRGYRIELSEIEHQLNTFREIMHSVIELKEIDDDKYLIAYYEAAIAYQVTDIRQHLGQYLPDYMIPSYYVQLDKLPLNSNGKIDKSSLPDYKILIEDEYVAPKTETEKKLINIWEEVLKIDSNVIGTTNNFFDLGGQSLKLVFLANRIKETFKVSLSLTRLVTNKNIQELAKEIETSLEEEYLKIPRAETKEYYPLSSTQKKFYFLHQLNKTSTVYNQPQMFVLKGEVDTIKLTAAFREVISHHEIFRVNFKLINDSPVQTFVNEVPFEMEYFKATPEETTMVVQKFMRPFDLSEGPLLRAGLIQINEKEHLLLTDRPHIISDGVSLKIFINDVFTVYQGKKILPVQLEYKDYTVWQESETFIKNLETQKKYWQEQFELTPEILKLQTDFQRPAVVSYNGAGVNFEIDTVQTQKLNELAKSLNTTLFSIVLGVFKIMLFKLTNQKDLIIGTPVSGRRHTDLENILGVFINVLALRNEIDSKDSLHTFLQRVHQTSIKSLENQDYPYEKLVNDLDISRDTSRNPLFDVMFVYTDAASYNLKLNGLEVNELPVEGDTSQMDLMLHVNVTENKGVNFNFQYATDLFYESTIKKFIKYFKKIIDQVDKDVLVGDIKILDKSEVEELKEFNKSKITFEIEENIVELFEKQALESANYKALIYKDSKLTYQELNERSNQLAAYLKNQGVKKGDIIGLIVNRSEDIIIGILGILKSGGAYLPIDSKLPFKRVKYMLESSKSNMLLGHEEYLTLYEGLINTHIINSPIIKKYSKENLNLDRSTSDLAYCIFTSGSTGTPKGVLMEQDSVVNLAEGLSQTVYKNLNPRLKIGMVASYYFDASCQQIFTALLKGHCLYICEEEERMDGQELYNFYKKNKIEVSDGTPTHLGMLLKSHKGNIDLPEFKAWLLAGEALPKKMAHKFYELSIMNKAVLYNIYGPTETCVDSTFYKIDPDLLNKYKTLPIGIPLPNERVYIVDSIGNPVPKGVIGELCIAGRGLARGYIGSTIENEKFIDNWIEGEDRVYRTGDLAFWLPDGNLAFKGRKDNQIKLRGYRIEIDEIEHVLTSHEFIIAGAIEVQEIAGEKYLSAYYVSKQYLDNETLRAYFGASLPDYMIPSFFIRLEKMPLTANGKLKRGALPIPDRVSDDQFIETSSETEKKLVEIWSKVLGIDEQSISINHSFIQLGGHSLMAVQIANKIKRVFNIEMKLVELFQKTTIKQQANFIEANLWIDSGNLIQKEETTEISI
ncbi:amino acid adenylation domain-containing protein [Tenacibaculum aiptasiae]|uniref:Amino acid adenylation domain-containing protein n=1 Tax=Tenacibaculum aiptasiae TaxID=426481 RepID=A0A7J5A939_9FLAO|nr:non-ribosomal peptide synthetase [Tenacibaculum aiptasiae]KAB1153659.1 amino acid adenylation domain-containing protein [Tenacibaculum aiptasiae]